jgi:hypothetical protein
MELVPRWGSPGLPAKDIVRMPRGKVFLFSGSQEACPIPEAEAPLPPAPLPLTPKDGNNELPAPPSPLPSP